VTILKILNPFNISGMDEAIRCLDLSNKWIDYASPTSRVEKFKPKGARGLGHVMVWGMKPRFSASTLASATPRVKNSPETGVVSVT